PPASPTADAPADDIGLRDVWRAARARRKALRAEMRRFTQRRRRRRAVWLAAAASVVVLVAVTVGAAYSPLFAVERIEVVGTSQLDPAAVEQALASEIGTPLASVDGSAVKAALVAFPLVESYALEARPPHDLVVRIVERTPVGAIQSRAGWTVVDAAGVVLSTSTGAPAGEPVLDITGGLSSPAFAAAATVMRALPDTIRPQVTAVTATTADDVTLTLGSRGVQVVWGGTTDSARKAVVLQQAMAAFPIASVSSYDISSPEAIVVR
ncbi:FtsQ-type POTRA domain-containing protein, partial [Microbacterium lemovicicum]